jgi:hypothetical protein
MNKSIKYAVYTLVAISATLALILLLANYVFTTKLSLSCTGKETTSISLGAKVTPIEIKDKLEGVTISITKYPFQNHKVIIASENVFLMTGDKETLISVLDTQVTGVTPTKNKDAEIYRSLSFNRLTKVVTIESLFNNLNNKTQLGTKFEGVCAEVKAL